MAEKVIRTVNELSQYISETAKRKNIPISHLEKKSNLGAGIVSRWKKADPGMSNVLKVLSGLEVDVILRDTLDTQPEPNIDFSALDSEYLKELSTISIDAKMLYIVTKILKEPNFTVADKEKLCKVLEEII